MHTSATVLLTSMTLLLSQAAWAELAAPVMADNTARIRLFGQNQRPTLAYVGIDCRTQPKGNKINVGGGLGDAFGSFTRTIKNTTLGMAATPATQSLSQRNGILSKAFYKELIVPAGLPLNAKAHFIGLSTTNIYQTDSGSSITTYRYTLTEKSTLSKGISFVPQAGHDYEILSLREQGKEYLIVTDITTPDFEAVAVNEPFSCKNKP